MGSGTFRGGIHPYDGKELSRDRVIQDIRPGKELAYLVSQHIGAPAKPIVKKGDRVLVGQMIAEAGGFVSAPVYASVSGVVKGIEKRLTATGGYCDAIIVENDEVYESVAFEETKDITQLSKDEIRGKIQKAAMEENRMIRNTLTQVMIREFFRMFMKFICWKASTKLSVVKPFLPPQLSGILIISRLCLKAFSTIM